MHEHPGKVRLGARTVALVVVQNLLDALRDFHVSSPHSREKAQRQIHDPSSLGNAAFGAHSGVLRNALAASAGRRRADRRPSPDRASARRPHRRRRGRPADAAMSGDAIARASSGARSTRTSGTPDPQGRQRQAGARRRSRAPRSATAAGHGGRGLRRNIDQAHLRAERRRHRDAGSSSAPADRQRTPRQARVPRDGDPRDP